MRKAVILSVMLTPVLMGAGGDAGCDNQSVPTMQQVELYVPESVLTCAQAKNVANPGANATKRQTAEYIVKLYAVAEECGADNATFAKLYRNWKSKVAKLQK